MSTKVIPAIPTARLRVGGPVIIDWPSGNPNIIRLGQYQEHYIGVWTTDLWNTTKAPDSERARFMVLQDHDVLAEPGAEVGAVEMPWFGRCRVYRLNYSALLHEPQHSVG